ITAHSGEDALKSGWQHQPDAVLLDIGMPDLNGYEVAGRMRITGWGWHALLIALTGWGQKDDIERAIAAGFDVHMTKPADPERIERLLQEFLAARPHAAAAEPESCHRNTNSNQRGRACPPRRGQRRPADGDAGIDRRHRRPAVRRDHGLPRRGRPADRAPSGGRR